MLGTSRGHTKCVLICASSGQTLQQKPVPQRADNPAAIHRPQVPFDTIRGGVELQEMQLKRLLPDGRDLAAEIILGAGWLEERCGAELPIDDTATI